MHHLHIDKIARGRHFHVTPNPKHSITIAKMNGCPWEMHVNTVG